MVSKLPLLLMNAGVGFWEEFQAGKCRRCTQGDLGSLFWQKQGTLTRNKLTILCGGVSPQGIILAATASQMGIRVKMVTGDQAFTDS